MSAQFKAVAFFVVLGGIFIGMYLQWTDVTVQEFFNTPHGPIVQIGSHAFPVLVADTDALRIQGLSGMDSLGDATGMLFIFDTAEYHGIWMKEMKFAIDIIWINENLRVVSIDKNVQPDSFPLVYRPSEPAKYVIETSARYTDIFNIVPGSTVTITR